MNIVATKFFLDTLNDLEPPLRKKIAKIIITLKTLGDPHIRNMEKVYQFKDNVYLLKGGNYRIFFTVEESRSTIILFEIQHRDIIDKMGLKQQEPFSNECSENKVSDHKNQTYNSPLTNEERRMRGRVKWFNPDKGYGFIDTEDSIDVFVDFSKDTLIKGKLEAGEMVDIDFGYTFVIDVKKNKPAKTKFKN